MGSGKKKGRPGGAKVGTEEAVLEGLRWLVRHQGEDGSWGPDICRARCNLKTPCIPANAEVQPFWNEGLTGLALLWRRVDRADRHRRVRPRGAHEDPLGVTADLLDRVELERARVAGPAEVVDRDAGRGAGLATNGLGLRAAAAGDE